MKYRLHICLIGLLLALAVTGVTSCEHRILEDMGNTHYVRVYIDDHILNVTEGFYDSTLERPDHQLPKVMRVMLCDSQTGRMVSERYLQNLDKDSRGYYLDGYIIAPPGDYELMTYNFGTELTQIHAENDFFGIAAYTNPISPTIYSKFPSLATKVSLSNVLYQPDHLFSITEREVHIRPSTQLDTLRTMEGDYFTARSVVKSYYIQVKVKGIEWVKSTASILTGVSRSKILSTNEIDSKNPAAVYFDMVTGEKVKSSVRNTDGKDIQFESAMVYSTFNIFDKIPGEQSDLHITFEFLKSDGKSQVETIDLTPLFDTPEAIEHQWLLLDQVITITPPKDAEGGGFSPGIDEWEDFESDIII